MRQHPMAAAEIAWERKKTKCEAIRQQCYGWSTTNLYPTNAREVDPWSRELQRVWFGGGGKKVYFRHPARTSFGKCSTRKASWPKIGSKPAGTT